MKKYSSFHPHETPKWCIDGKTFPTISAAFGFAQAHGFNGTKGGLRDRIVNGKGTVTLDDLVRPLDYRAESCNKARAVMNANRKKSKDEMAELLAGIDARKASIGYDY